MSKSIGEGGVFGVGVAVGVTVGVAVGVGVGVTVGVAVGVGVCVGVCVGVGVKVRVGVTVGLGVEVGVAVRVGVGVMVAVGVGVAVGRRVHTLGVPEQEYPPSTAHTDEHPSVLVAFPSSQASPVLRYPSPQVGTVQIEVQVSPSTTLPSSHSSRRPV
jgi:hypothetical protein